MPSKVSIVIPVFNEVETIEELLRRVLEQPIPGLEKEVVIVESRSTDGTREKIQKFLMDYSHSGVKVKLILQESPCGKGHAVREGLQSVTGDIILIQDGDLEYDVRDYPTLLDPILQGKAELVLGSRHLGVGHWKIRRFEENQVKSALLNLGGVFFHSFFNLLYQQRLTDPTTMYKVFRTDCLEGIVLQANRFDFDYELLGKLLRKGYQPYEVPVSYVSRSFKEGKKIRVFRDPWTWLIAIVRYRLSPIGQHKERGYFSSCLFKYLLFACFLFVSSKVLLSYFGGPLVSPDSVFYLESSEKPWRIIGGWHPAGLSFLLYFGFHLGMSLQTIMHCLFTFFGVMTYWVLRRGWGASLAWVGFLGLFLDPSWMMLRLTLWTELPFVTVLICFAALFSAKSVGWKFRLTVATVMFLILIQFRHAGLFFLPAWVAALGYAWENQKWRFSLRRARNALGTFACVWVLYALITTHGLSSATHHPGEECRTLLVSFNEFPYCQWDSTIPICKLDPERKILNQKSFVLDQSQRGYRDPDADLKQTGLTLVSDQLIFLQYSAGSPINQFRETDTYNICHLRKDILKTVLIHHPLEVLKVLARRVGWHFGSWDWTERSRPQLDVRYQDRLTSLDSLLRIWNRFQWIFQCLLVLVVARVVCFRPRSPVLVFLLLGCLGHAIGISLVNPFLSLRYMAISKFLLVMSFGFIYRPVFQPTTRP